MGRRFQSLGFFCGTEPVVISSLCSEFQYAVKQPAKIVRRPSILKYARVLIALQVLRLIGLSLIPLPQNNTLPASFVIPTVIGDTSTAVTAPVIAYTLGRGGPKTWAAGLVWNGVGLIDLFYAQTLAYITRVTMYLFASDPLIPFGAYLAAIFHIVTLIFLLEKRTTNHLLRL